MKNNKERKINRESGISLFIAVTITSILLVISYSILNIALKSVLFASSGRDSQLAFYAADAGVECAVYWDTRFDPSKFDTSVSGSPITCGTSISTGATIPGTTTTVCIGGPCALAKGGTSILYFNLNQGNNPLNYCAIVTVTKSGGATSIKSKGYNTCDTANPRRVERGIDVNY